MPPLDACTYAGLDNGAKPLSVSHTPFSLPLKDTLHFQLSLFFDVLLCLTTEISQQDYINGSSPSPSSENNIAAQSPQQRARSLLWKALKGTTMMKAGGCVMEWLGLKVTCLC